MKKLKFLFLGIVGLVLLFFLAYGIFRIKEYFAGKKYVEYARNNSESVSLDDQFTYDILSEDISNHSLILAGEIHGFEEPAKFDVDFFDHINSEYDVNSYILEMDHSQAYFMNKFNETGDEKLLRRILVKWVVSAGRNNLDYFDKWVSLSKVYTKHPFTYYGNNNISDLNLLVDHINDLSGKENIILNESLSDSLQLIQIKSSLEFLKNELDVESDSIDLNWNYIHLLKNVNYELENKYREEILTENLVDLYSHYKLKQQKVYGFFGIGHTLLETFRSGYQPMAKRVKELDTWFENNILSLNFIFCDSYMVMPSKSLPSILQDNGEYTRMPVSYDNVWLSYMYGIEDLKRIGDDRTKTIIKLNGNNSPYFGSDRLFSMFKILPFGQVINAKENASAIDYAQYVIFVRNSDWAEPSNSVNK